MRKMPPPTASNYLDTQDKLSVSSAVVAALVISAVILVAVGFALLINHQRQSAIVAKYSFETLQLVENNPTGFRELLTTTMDNCQQELNLAQASAKTRNEYWPKDVQCQAAVQKLGQLGVDQLHDSSATVYLRMLGNIHRESGDDYQMIEASGKFSGLRSLSSSNNQFSYNSENIARRYFIYHQAAPMWADYIRFIPGKEVIVPIELPDGTDGYILRGVIEK